MPSTQLQVSFGIDHEYLESICAIRTRTREREGKLSPYETRLQKVPKRIENVISKQPEMGWAYKGLV